METVASVENMEDVATAFGASLEGSSSTMQETQTSLDRLVEDAEAAVAAAERACEDACESVAGLQKEVESLEGDVSEADGGDEGNAAAEELANVQEQLAEARDRLASCEACREKAVETARKAEDLRDQYFKACRVSLMRMEALAEDCTARVRHAREALERYIGEHPESAAAAFAKWARWTPSPSEIVTPQALANRLRLSGGLLREAIAYEAERDSAFRAKLENYGQQYREAKTLSEKKAILRQLHINGSGELAERIVKSAFRPLGDVSTQNRVFFNDGRYTKIDLVVHNLRSPVLLGRGERSYAPKNGTLALEVKAGKASYLEAQADHLVFQAGGHCGADASATICTADIHDLFEEKERGLRERLRAAGSPLLGMLPRKNEIDRKLDEAVAYGIGKERP